MLFINRYNIKEGRNSEYRRWLLEHEDAIAEGAGDGWRYLGTYFTVRGLGQFDVETHWELDDYAALGAGFGDAAYQQLMGEWLGFVDGQIQGCLMKSAKDVRIVDAT